jgi:hypothetical protein
VSEQTTPTPIYIPPIYRRTCTVSGPDCVGMFDMRQAHHGERVTGIAVNRTQGGANQITLPVRTGEWVCRWCIDRLKRGHNAEQGTLL